jgi:hypothetical protein
MKQVDRGVIAEAELLLLGLVRQLTAEECDADYRLTLRAALEDLQRHEPDDPSLPLIAAELEDDTSELEQEDELIWEAWCVRQGWTREQPQP